MPNTLKNLPHHQKLALLLLAITLATLPLAAWVATNPTRLVTKAYNPKHCPAAQIPRERHCSTGWILKTLPTGCKTYTCES